MATDMASSTPVLPPRPMNPLPRAPDARSIIIPTDPAQPSKSTWAIAAKKRLRQKVVPNIKAAPQPAATASKKEAPEA